MKPGSAAIYNGTVVHTRLRPVEHTLRYGVFSMMFELDRLKELDKRLKLFSFNRFNLVSLYEKDFAERTGFQPWLDDIAKEAGVKADIGRYSMLCYPRILGIAFNPLTVYFGMDDNDAIRLTVYEVHNTFGGRKTYAIPAEPDENGLVYQSCAKEFYVSPFNKVEGSYSFHVTPLQEDLTLGVALKDGEGPKLRAHFKGHRAEVTDGNLLRAVGRTGWLTIKVVAGIYYEAAKLWFKGMRLVKESPHPDKPLTVISKKNSGEETAEQSSDRAA